MTLNLDALKSLKEINSVQGSGLVTYFVSAGSDI